MIPTEEVMTLHKSSKQGYRVEQGRQVTKTWRINTLAIAKL